MSFQNISIEKAFGRLLVNARLNSSAGTVSQIQFERHWTKVARFIRLFFMSVCECVAVAAP